MKDLLDKLSSYNIFNYLFPGVLFAIIGSHISPFKLVLEDNIQGAFLYYLYGLAISRLGSHVVEPLYKKLKIIKFAPYPEYVAASRVDPFIGTLSEQNNMFRTLLATVLAIAILCILGPIITKHPNLQNFSNLTLLLFATALLSCSYSKQTKYVRERVEGVNNSTLKPESTDTK